jgi:hypothetical protein
MGAKTRKNYQKMEKKFQREQAQMVVNLRATLIAVNIKLEVLTQEETIEVLWMDKIRPLAYQTSYKISTIQQFLRQEMKPTTMEGKLPIMQVEFYVLSQLTSPIH